MTAVVKTVKKLGKSIEKVGKTIVRTVEKVGKAIESTVNTIEKAVKTLGDIAQPLLERGLIQAALQVALPGVGQLAIAAMSAGFHTLARGGKPEDAIKAAATVVVVDKVGLSVAKSAKEAGFTATQVAAAQSAAQSAVATAAAGGDISQVLKAAAIGSVSGIAGTEILNQTQNAALATFTRTAVASALNGQKIDEAILNGASSAAVGYLREIQEKQNKLNNEINNHKAYAARVEKQIISFNQFVDKYNDPNTSEQELRNIETFIERDAAEIQSAIERVNMNYERIGKFTSEIDDLIFKASEEFEKTGGDYAEQAISDFSEQQQMLFNQIQDVASREFGAAEEGLVQLAGLQTSDVPFRVDIAQNQVLVRGEGALIYEDGSVVDRETGEVVGQLNDQQLSQLNLSLREQEAQTIIADGRETIGSLAKIRDEAQQDLETVVDPNLREQIQNTINTANENIARLESEVQRAQADINEAVAQREQIEGDFEKAVQEMRQAAEQPVEPEFLSPEDKEILDVLEEEASGVSPETVVVGEEAGAQEPSGEVVDIGVDFDKELDAIEQELEQADDEARQGLQDSLVDTIRKDIEIGGETIPGDVLDEIETIISDYESGKTGEGGVDYSLTAGDTRPPVLDGMGGQGLQADLEELPPAETIGTQPIDFENIFNLPQEDRGREDMGGGQGITVPESPALEDMGGGTGLTIPVDEGVVSEEGLTLEDEILRQIQEELYPTPEDEVELGGGEGGPTEEETAAPKPVSDKVMPATVVSRETPSFAPRGTTPGYGTRVTGETLTGILGEKEPLFGGDEDEQRAVWNRRSLRLRRALGL